MYPISPKNDHNNSPFPHSDFDPYTRADFSQLNIPSDLERKAYQFPKNDDEELKPLSLHVEEMPINNVDYYCCLLPNPPMPNSGIPNEKEGGFDDCFMFSQMMAPTMAPFVTFLNPWQYMMPANEAIPQQPETQKKIGKLTSEERLKKIMHYREKRKNRIFSKRINYECRKRVADQRIRVQGRFVAKKDAIDLIKQIGHNENELNNEIHQVNRLLNNSNVKEMLKNKKMKGCKKAIFKTMQMGVDSTL